MMSTMHASLFMGAILSLPSCSVSCPLPSGTRTPCAACSVINPWVQGLGRRCWGGASAPDPVARVGRLGAVQLGWVADTIHSAVPARKRDASNPLLDALQHEGDRVRVTVAVGDPDDEFLLQNQFAAMGISCLDISAASRYPVDLNLFLHALDNEHARLWFLAGVKNVVVPEAD